METRSVADVEGPWLDTANFTSGLIERCKSHWHTPVSQLPDIMVATFLRQRIGIALMMPEAQRRLASGARDDTELYEGQLAKALDDVSAA